MMETTKRNLRRDPSAGRPMLQPHEEVVYPEGHDDDTDPFVEEVNRMMEDLEFGDVHELSDIDHNDNEDDKPWVDLGRYRQDHPVES